jgi:hypothetical protein
MTRDMAEESFLGEIKQHGPPPQAMNRLHNSHTKVEQDSQ